MKEPEKKKNVTITMLPSVKEMAEKMAKESKRSLSSHIEFLIEESQKLSKAKK